MNSDMAMSTEILNKDKQEFVFGLKKATIGFIYLFIFLCVCVLIVK